MPSVIPKLLRRVLAVALVLHLSAATSLVAAQRRATPALDPRTDVSASGAYSLRVEPGSPAGRGAAHYRLEHAGKEAWSAELPFTLWESVVADDGTVAGYAYGNGLDGWSGVRGDHGEGDFRVVILDPQGSPRLDLATERTFSRFLHMLPTPEAAGLLLDGDNDRIVFRIDDADVNRASEEWWPFRLSTGETLGRFRPREQLEDPETARWIIRARPVKQTSLWLLNWWTFHFSSEHGWMVGARFTLMDLDGSPVWTLDLPTDYSLPGDETGEDRLHDAIRHDSAILSCAEPGRFEIGLVAEGKRVTFEAQAEPVPQEATPKQRWKVVEIGRADWSPLEPRDASETATGTAAGAGSAADSATGAGAVTEGRLEQTGSFMLGQAAAPGSFFGRIRHFDLDDRGRFGFTREDGDVARSFLLVSPEGLVLAELPLDLGPLGEDVSVAAEWIAGNRWLLYVRWPSGGGNENPAWWLDVESRRIEPIADFRFPEIRSIDGDGRGGFVALGSKQLESSIEEMIVAIDAAGRARWSVAGDSRDETGPLSPEAVAVATDGSVGILDNTRNLVFVYGPDGSRAPTIDLEQRWGREPNYVSDLAADAHGGWIVHDFQGDAPLVRMSPDGEVVGKLAPAFPDGRKLDPIGPLVAALDGGVWTTDGHALLHVNAQSVIDRIAGSAPDADRIDAIAAVVVDLQGRILVGDERTGAVHVFDGKGARLFVCRPAPQDEQGCRRIAAAPDGRLFAGGEKGLVCYSSSGERTGTTGRILDFSDEQWLFQPQGGRRWVVGYPGLVLADGDGKIVRRIEKRPDGTWLEHPGEAGMAPDGSLAVIGGSVCLYAPDGEARQQFPLPAGIGSYARIAFDGKRIVLATEEELFVRGTTQDGWKRYPFATKIAGFSALSLEPDGERIRLVPYQSAQVLEFRLAD